MYSVKEAGDYLHVMEDAARGICTNPDGLYYGIDGHKRLARECGYALNDFDEIGRKEILSSSYGTIYMIACNLHPLIDAKKWMGIMRSQIKKS